MSFLSGERAILSRGPKASERIFTNRLDRVERKAGVNREQFDSPPPQSVQPAAAGACPNAPLPILRQRENLAMRCLDKAAIGLLRTKKSAAERPNPDRAGTVFHQRFGFDRAEAFGKLPGFELPPTGIELEQS